MEFRQLRYLTTIADEGNFTRAAEQLYVSQSALSQQIQALEQEIGTQLLDRSKRGVTLTAAGEILYHHANRIFLEMEEAQLAIRELDGLQRGELRVGVVQTVNAYLMPSILSQFAAAYPAIRLLVDELANDDIEVELEQGNIQLGIGFIPPASAYLEAKPLFQEELVLVVRDDHPLAVHSELPVKALHDLPMIMLANTFCTRRLWEENARLASAQPRVVMEMNTVSSILSVVLKTGLATVLPELTLMEERADNLVSLHLHKPTPSRQVGLIWHRENYLCSASRAFMDATERTVQSSISLLR